MATIYIETSIVSYLTARPSRDVVSLTRQEVTRTWWQVERRYHALVMSDIVLGEASGEHEEAARRRLDALHIAIATAESVEYLLARNCTHIANAAM